MRDSYHTRQRRAASIHDGERKLAERVSATALEINGPAHRRLPDLLDALRPNDLLIITSDHGCDPTTPSTDHLISFGDQSTA